MHNLHFKLKHKIAKDVFVELLKDNMNSQMGGLLLTSPITSLAELKREGLRVDRWLRNTEKNMRSRAAVNEIEEFQTLEDLSDAVTVEEFNRQRKVLNGTLTGQCSQHILQCQPTTQSQLRKLLP